MDDIPKKKYEEHEPLPQCAQLIGVTDKSFSVVINSLIKVHASYKESDYVYDQAGGAQYRIHRESDD